MGVRPPGQTDDSGSTMVEFGIPALAALLDEAEISFPVTREEVIRELDNPEIPVNAHGNSISLDQAMQDIDTTEFDSERDLLNALHPVFETYRMEGSTGILGSIRAILPF